MYNIAITKRMQWGIKYYNVNNYLSLAPTTSMSPLPTAPHLQQIPSECTLNSSPVSSKRLSLLQSTCRCQI